MQHTTVVVKGEEDMPPSLKTNGIYFYEVALQTMAVLQVASTLEFPGMEPRVSC